MDVFFFKEDIIKVEGVRALYNACHKISENRLSGDGSNLSRFIFSRLLWHCSLLSGIVNHRLMKRVILIASCWNIPEQNTTIWWRQSNNNSRIIRGGGTSDFFSFSFEFPTVLLRWIHCLVFTTYIKMLTTCLYCIESPKEMII